MQFEFVCFFNSILPERMCKNRKSLHLLLNRSFSVCRPLTSLPVARVLGGAAAHVVERALRPQCRPVLNAAACGASVGGGGPACVSYVGRAGGGLHGPHPRLPGAGGEAEGPAGGHGRVFLPQVHRALHFW